jgi:hypothetical protein
MTTQNIPRLTKLYSLLIVTLSIVGVIYSGIYWRIFFAGLIIAALGLFKLKKWALYLTVALIVIGVCSHVFVAISDSVFDLGQPCHNDGVCYLYKLMASGFILIELIPFIIPTFYLWTKRNYFT